MTRATSTPVVIFLAPATRPGCRDCTHPWDIHQHYRTGTPCSAADCTCHRYRTLRWGHRPPPPRRRR